MPRPRTRPETPETPFATWLKGEIAALGLNVSQFGVYAGFPRATVNAWLREGRTPASLESRQKIADYLQVPIELVNAKCGDPAGAAYEEPEYPTWFRKAIEGLEDWELQVVARTAQGLREARDHPGPA